MDTATALPIGTAGIGPDAVDEINLPTAESASAKALSGFRSIVTQATQSAIDAGFSQAQLNVTNVNEDHVDLIKSELLAKGYAASTNRVVRGAESLKILTVKY